MNPGVMMSTDESAWSLSLFQNVTVSRTSIRKKNQEHFGLLEL